MSGVWSSIIGEVFTQSQIASNLGVLCDEIGGRMSGGPSGAKAEQFALDRFREYGFERVHFEPFDLLSWERGPFEATVLQPVQRKLTAVALGNTGSTDEEGIGTPLVDAGFGNPKAFEELGGQVKGKMALVFDGAPPGERTRHRSEKMRLVIQHGACGMAYVGNTPGALAVTGMCYKDGVCPALGIGLSREDGEWLRRGLQSDQQVEIKVKMRSESRQASASNVVAEWPGTSLPDELVIVGGHLDSWDLGTGALDNGSGVAVILEAARVLAKINARPKRTIQFALFMGEELGLCGSRAYVQQHQEVLDQVAAMLNLDIVGTPQSYVVYGHPEASNFLGKLAQQLEHLGLSDQVGGKAGLHSDRQPFMIEGVPTMSISCKVESDAGKYYHTAADTFEKVPEKPLNDCAAVVAITLLELANAEPRPTRRFPPEETKTMLIEKDLQEALRSQGEWKFGDG